MAKMNDRSRPLDIAENPLAKIKGHVRIELHDTRTGSNERIEGHNTFQTNVLKKYMRSLGFFQNSPYDNSTWRSQAVWRNLCGGILLFKDSIDLTNGDVLTMPAGNKMTANSAYGVSNSGNPVELGSYNSVESVAGTSGITMVYDWNTSQGNGTIGSICLTSETGGYIGYGNSSGTSGGMRQLRTNQPYNDTEDITSSNYVHAIYGNNVYTNAAIDSTNKKVTLTYTTRGITTATIFDGMTRTKEYTYTGDLSGALETYQTARPKLCVDGGYMYVLPYYTASSVANGGTYKYLKINLTTDAITVETLTNSSGAAIYISQFYDMLIYDGVIYAPKSNRGGGNNVNVARIKLSDSSYLGDIKTYEYDWTNVSVLSKGLIMHARDTGGRMYIYDTATGTDYFTNGYALTDPSSSYTTHGGYITDGNSAEDGLLIHAYSYNYKNMDITKNPLYLATVYNLDEAVTKTASQTMKVTYTLTEAEEEE